MPVVNAFADTDKFEPFSTVQMYSVYDENFSLLFQKDYVEVGDGYLSKEQKYYEVVYVSHESKTALAKFVRNVELPKVGVSNLPNRISVGKRVICMYMTHNDESYVPSDGVDSIYGNGGVKDVANSLKTELEKHFVDVYFDDTLHIPHDTSAYDRSLKTAKSLQNAYSPDALLDIHRDATSRKYYVTNVGGKERGRVRMVIGKANPNMALNEQFALYLMAVAEEMYPWLFTDIFYAKGHYNQNLDSKAILFECGSHLVEKELEMESMKELADVLCTALYNTTVNKSSGDLTINGNPDDENKTINQYLNEKSKTNISVLAVVLTIAIMSFVCVYAIYLFWKNVKESKAKNDSKKQK